MKKVKVRKFEVDAETPLSKWLSKNLSDAKRYVYILKSTLYQYDISYMTLYDISYINIRRKRQIKSNLFSRQQGNDAGRRQFVAKTMNEIQELLKLKDLYWASVWGLNLQPGVVRSFYNYCKGQFQSSKEYNSLFLFRVKRIKFEK